MCNIDVEYGNPELVCCVGNISVSVYCYLLAIVSGAPTRVTSGVIGSAEPLIVSFVPFISLFLPF